MTDINERLTKWARENKPCSVCDGQGKTFYRGCANAGEDAEWIVCTSCKGTGTTLQLEVLRSLIDSERHEAAAEALEEIERLRLDFAGVARLVGHPMEGQNIVDRVDEKLTELEPAYGTPGKPRRVVELEAEIERITRERDEAIAECRRLACSRETVMATECERDVALARVATLEEVLRPFADPNYPGIAIGDHERAITALKSKFGSACNYSMPRQSQKDE